MSACACLAALHGVSVSVHGTPDGVHGQQLTTASEFYTKAIAPSISTLQDLVLTCDEKNLMCYAGLILGAVAVNLEAHSTSSQGTRGDVHANMRSQAHHPAIVARNDGQYPQAFDYLAKESALRCVYNIMVDGSLRENDMSVMNTVKLLNSMDVLPPIDLTPVIQFVLSSPGLNSVHAEAVSLLLRHASRPPSNTELALSFIEADTFKGLPQDAQIIVCENIHKVLETVSNDSEQTLTATLVALVLSSTNLELMGAILVGLAALCANHQAQAHVHAQV
ncbi:hypothetical protein SARC_13781, partial [Sphaeroforma arctica JP610]